MIFCKNCKYFKRTECFVDSIFIDGNKETQLIYTNEWGISMCHHPSCFETNSARKPEGTETTKERIAGQAQLNATNMCELYKRKWWKFFK